MLKYLLSCLLLAQTCALFSQNIWTDISEKALAKTQNAPRLIQPRQYRTIRLDLTQLQSLLAAAPERFKPASGPEQEVVLTLPLPDGRQERFRLTESPVMAPALQAKYPQIRCYTGTGIDDPTASLKCDLTPQGFHAMIRSARSGTIFIDPYTQGDTEHCIVYDKKHLDPKEPFTCTLDAEFEMSEVIKNPVPEAVGDCTFRRYRLALACTGEYATFHGGTVPLVLAAMNTTMNRVNGIYEQDLAVTMVLIPNNDLLVFLDPVTDGYSNGNGTSMLGQNQTKCTTVIGSANYDIGHVFSTGGGGVAGVGVVCNNSTKARGVTGRNQPIGDPFDVDYVAHEMGHQFNGNHTQNNSCGRNTPTAMEPGSASTIMGYAGICSPNIQPNSDPYFHAVNLQEMSSYITTGPGNVCPVKIVSGNNAPTANAGADYVIPRSTPFALTATASDTDSDPITYCWEQMNNQTATMPPLATNTAGPMFRSLQPTLSPTRYFPNLQDLVSNADPTWERLPGVARTLNFRVTVRDNNSATSCTAEDNMLLTVDGTAGPFVVTEPNTSVTWYVGETKTVTWDVAATDAAPVSCSTVRILLSTDGGFTYPFMLANAAPNSGSANVLVPNELSPTCRVMVQSVGNVFFDISNENFRIEIPPAPTFFLNVLANASEQLCTGQTLHFTAEIDSFEGYNTPVNLALTGAPANATISITPNPVAPGNSAEIDISNLTQPSAYTLLLTAQGDTIVRTFTIELAVVEGVPETPTLISPADGAPNATQQPTLTWSAVPDALFYQVQVATSPAFGGTIVSDQTAADTSAAITGLEIATVYYWRVRMENACGISAFSPVFAFQTGQPACGFDFSSTDVPVDISSTSTSTVTSDLTVADSRFVADVHVGLKIDHSWVGDLIVRLIAPDGAAAVLLDQPGFPGLSSGCNGENLDIGLDDEALLTATDLENTCDNLPAISGTFQPVDALDRFDNKNAAGVWKVEVADNFPEDGGAIVDWSLSFCFFEAVLPAEILVNNPLILASSSTKTLGLDHLVLQIFSGNAADGVFTLLSLPQHGDLLLNGLSLGIGSTFTQDDIISGAVAYANNGDGATSDTFLFDVLDNSTSSWVHSAVFNIVVIQNDLNVSAELTQALLCHDATTAQISVSVAGGTPPLQYSLNGGTPQFSNVFNGLPAGTYTIVVTDDYGFTAQTNPVDVDNPASINAAASATNDDISIQVISGGLPPYTYSLDGAAFQSDSNFENLPNGDYTVTVRDANGCTGTATVTVFVGPLLFQQISTTPTSCHAGADGSLTVQVAGGVPPYQYSLNGVDFQDSNIFSGLSAGPYTVVVQDDSGNTATETATVAQPTVIEVLVTVLLNEITITASGGTGVLEYSLDGQVFQFGNTFGGLPNGEYTLTVRDANGCTVMANATVAVPPLVITGLTVTGAIFCAGETVSVLVSAIGGVPPYEYSLDGGAYQTDSLFTNVGGGIHEILVRDAAGTVQPSQPFTLANPEPVSASALLDGTKATIIATGGLPPYQFSLNGSPPQDFNEFSNLANGDYEATVTDANGCTAIIAFQIFYIPLSLGMTGFNPSCNGLSDGSFLLEILGGTPPYTCKMNGNDPCTSSNLPAGTYTVIIVDDLGESATATVTLTDPPALGVSADASDNVITAAATGGTGNIEYSLDGLVYQTAAVFSDLPNGVYTVTVRDENGCTAVSDTVLVDFVGTIYPEQIWGLTVQPNPSVGHFVLTLRNAPSGMLQADVFDTGGRHLQRQKFEPNGALFSTTLDLTGFPPGVYTLRLVSSGQAGAVRLVVGK